MLEVNKDQIVAYLDQDIETEKDQKEEESKEKKEYYIHQIDLVFQDEVRRQLNVLHLENFKNLIFPPFSPPPEYC